MLHDQTDIYHTAQSGVPSHVYGNKGHEMAHRQYQIDMQPLTVARKCRRTWRHNTQNELVPYHSKSHTWLYISARYNMARCHLQFHYHQRVHITLQAYALSVMGLLCCCRVAI
mgnify:CR=1 FL=1